MGLPDWSTRNGKTKALEASRDRFNRTLGEIESPSTHSLSSGWALDGVDLTARRNACSLLQLVVGRSTRQELAPALFGHVGGCGRLQEILQDC